ncbi:hypothetical protein JHK85_010483 [Glycine max]|nr:hypothetical protein JHK85_010483 [Glycine max]
MLAKVCNIHSPCRKPSTYFGRSIQHLDTSILEEATTLSNSHSQADCTKQCKYHQNYGHSTEGSMLQSIHQGQIILLQSLQLVAPPDSIPMTEQFNEWVAWPGTQPPLHREDENPAAQVPHQRKDES